MPGNCTHSQSKPAQLEKAHPLPKSGRASAKQIRIPPYLCWPTMQNPETHVGDQVMSFQTFELETALLNGQATFHAQLVGL